jgi:hypothetical protein
MTLKAIPMSAIAFLSDLRLAQGRRTILFQRRFGCHRPSHAGVTGPVISYQGLPERLASDRRESCASRGFRTSRLWRSCARRIAIRPLRWRSGTGELSRVDPSRDRAQVEAAVARVVDVALAVASWPNLQHVEEGRVSAVGLIDRSDQRAPSPDILSRNAMSATRTSGS